ncbi:predicted protein [Naegleria gruberi]|uniref:Predicted protein n=1 Tax=Naegleria gruberi TaxID=5762 RepID=D2VVY1_NAEGR|nr:uncharacterized protein NAEGRDRAFT_52686 [Naegleria gruberi]EFC38922.1 predicted protein [Naegleria gruberi]|eukprot:XP_002671666.1 predicted protein [Naegleria gruberi strain NEG-M]
MGNFFPSVTLEPQQKTELESKLKRKIDSVGAYPVRSPKKKVHTKSETKKYLPSDILQFFDIPLVNREIACRNLMDSLIEQKSSANHGLLPILSQHYGSGKTRLLREFRQALKERNDLEQFTCCESETSSAVANNIMQAVLVDMPLNRATLTNSIEKDLQFPLGGISRLFLLRLKTSIEEHAAISKDPLVSKTMNVLRYVGACTYNHVSDLSFEEKDIITELSFCSDWMQFLQFYSRNRLYPILILIDEASYLEYHYKDGHVSFVYLWEKVIKPTMGSSSPGIYFVACGTSSTLTKLGRGLLRNETKLISPTNAIHITLEMLKEEHIMEIFEKVIISKDGKLNVRQFTSIFCNIGNNYEYFCKTVFWFTMGVPRLVLYVLSSLTRHVKSNGPLDFSTRGKIDDVFNNFEAGPELSLVKTAKEIFPFNECTSTKDNLSRFRSILTMGVLRFPIPVTEEFLTEIDLIHDLNVAVETPTINIDGKPTVMIKMFIPRFTLIKAAKQESLQHLSVLASLPSNYYRYIDKVDLLEQLFHDTILTRVLVTIKFSNATRWQNIHSIFSHSQFLTDKKVEREHELFMTTSVLGPPAPKSKSPGFLISVPEGNSIIGIACKTNMFSSIFSLKMLQDEIDKASLLEKNITLFVFARQLTAELVQSCKDLGYLKLTEGKWSFGSGLSCSKLTTPPTGVWAKGLKFIEKTINVYKNMEVIILGNDLFSSFFTKEDIELLTEISTAKTYPKMGLVENWVQSLIQ